MMMDGADDGADDGATSGAGLQDTTAHRAHMGGVHA